MTPQQIAQLPGLIAELQAQLAAALPHVRYYEQQLLYWNISWGEREAARYWINRAAALQYTLGLMQTGVWGGGD